MSPNCEIECQNLAIIGQPIVSPTCHWFFLVYVKYNSTLNFCAIDAFRYYIILAFLVYNPCHWVLALISH